MTDRSRLCRAASVTKVAGSKLPLDNLNKILIVPLTTHPSELSMSDVGREILSHLQGRPEFSNVLSFFFFFLLLLLNLRQESYCAPQSRLPQLPECLVYRCVLPHLARYFGFGFSFLSGSLPGIEM